MKPDFNKIAFFAAIIVVAVLVALGKLPATSLTALLAAGGLAAWAAPSPFQGKPPTGDK